MPAPPCPRNALGMAPEATSTTPASATRPHTLARRTVDLISAAPRMTVVLTESPVFLHDRLFRQVDEHRHGPRRRLTFRSGRREDEADDAVARFTLLGLAADHHL